MPWTHTRGGGGVAGVDSQGRRKDDYDDGFPIWGHNEGKRQGRGGEQIETCTAEVNLHYRRSWKQRPHCGLLWTLYIAAHPSVQQNMCVCVGRVSLPPPPPPKYTGQSPAVWVRTIPDRLNPPLPQTHMPPSHSSAVMPPTPEIESRQQERMAEQ